MKSTTLFGSCVICTLALGGVLVVACGGATETDLFASGSSGSSGASSGASGTSGTSGTSGASGTSGSSGTSGTTADAGSSGTSGTSGSSGGVACNTADKNACPASQYCKVASCGTTGTCETRPTTQPPQLAPQCGCDGVTYWNETIAAGFGVNVKASGECVTGAVQCSSQSSSCSEGRTCDLGDKQCGGINPITIGKCWGIPSTCSGTALYRRCGGIGGVGKCLSRCEAIDTEQRYVEDTENCK